MLGTTPSPVHSLALAAALSLLPLAAQSACTPDKVSIKGGFGTVSFKVELADTPQTRAIGLMNRASMPRFSGMLFIYERPQALAFWMRNTLIPLDMLFVEPSGRIAKIHANAVPLDETPIEGGQGLSHVLEINGGLAAQLGISEGDTLRHPSIPQQTALWPCGTQ